MGYDAVGIGHHGAIVDAIENQVKQFQLLFQLLFPARGRNLLMVPHAHGVLQRSGDGRLF
jgi:hypothetical protein